MGVVWDEFPPGGGVTCGALRAAVVAWARLIDDAGRKDAAPPVGETPLLAENADKEEFEIISRNLVRKADYPVNGPDEFVSKIRRCPVSRRGAGSPPPLHHAFLSGPAQPRPAGFCLPSTPGRRRPRRKRN